MSNTFIKVRLIWFINNFIGIPFLRPIYFNPILLRICMLTHLYKSVTRSLITKLNQRILKIAVAFQLFKTRCFKI